MNLRSCKNCGVVLDFDFIKPPPMYDNHGDFIQENVYWDGEDYIAKILCPVCKECIF